MASNIDKLGETLHGQMNRTYNAKSSVSVELGSIVAGMALQPDFSPGPIPKGEYMISLRLTMGKKDDEFASTTTDSTPAHSHKVKLPDQMRAPKVGDRVLIIWSGKTPVVTDIVTAS